MSAPLAGKFQDHYVILGVDPQADTDAIQQAYSQLCEKFGPDNFDTGDPDKLASVRLAFEILTDPVLRREFDKLKGFDQEQGTPKFSGRPFFEVKGRETGLRLALLSILYDRRRTQPYRPSLSNRFAEGMLEADNGELTFTLWYLKQRNFITADDKSSLLITIEGMHYLENNWPTADDVLPFIKPSALATPAQDAETSMAARGKRGARIVGMLRSNVAPSEGQ